MSARGLHKAAGGFRARWRQAWEQLHNMHCSLPSCDNDAAGLVETLLGAPKPICAGHIPAARRRGYTVYESPKEEHA